MAVTKTYARPKVAATNSTGIVLTIKAAELPDTPDVLTGVGGTTGVLDARIQADADESGGADVQDLFKIVATPAVDASGNVSITVTVTPIKGGASAGTPGTLTVVHDETMDIWQAAAGRARQS